MRLTGQIDLSTALWYNAIKNCKLDIPFKLQLYADDIIAQGKTIEDLNSIYNKLKHELGKINLTINPDKCEIISDEVNIS